jgi:hypothetical protein
LVAMRLQDLEWQSATLHVQGLGSDSEMIRGPRATAVTGVVWVAGSAKVALEGVSVVRAADTEAGRGSEAVGRVEALVASE